jgi:metal-sulfur cluster biosynthetic enzyme
MSAAPQDLGDQVRNALRLVIDPELGFNIVDLGLVYEIAVADGGVANIRMTTTTRGCPATGFLKSGAQEAAWAVPGIEFVDVRLTYEPPWAPRMMSAAARQHLGMPDDED